MRQPRAVSLETLSAEEVSGEVLTELEALYATAYHGSHMHADLVADLRQRPAIFRLFVVRDAAGGDVVGARVIESKRHAAFDYLGFPPVHGKRFCVSPAHRGMGIGARLIEAGKAYVFDELGLSVIFGESNELGALALHGRAGALLRTDSIAAALRRNRPSDAVALFGRLLSDPQLRALRLPVGEGVQFVYCADARTAQGFRERGYLPVTA